jgi:phosphoglycerate dehydrogenase-like enzyme
LSGFYDVVSNGWISGYVLDTLGTHHGYYGLMSLLLVVGTPHVATSESLGFVVHVDLIQ